MKIFFTSKTLQVGKEKEPFKPFRLRGQKIQAKKAFLGTFWKIFTKKLRFFGTRSPLKIFRKILRSISQRWISENSSKRDILGRQGVESLRKENDAPPPPINPPLGRNIPNLGGRSKRSKFWPRRDGRTMPNFGRDSWNIPNFYRDGHNTVSTAIRTVYSMKIKSVHHAEIHIALRQQVFQIWIWNLGGGME